MIITWILVAGGVSTLAGLGYLATRNRADQTAGIEQAIAMIRSIDLEAFRNLVDPEEDAFLRRCLSPREFRDVQRERARAALAYVRSAGQAAVLFAKAGQAAQRSADPEVAESGMQIAESALRLRLSTLQAGARLYTAAVLPSAIDLPATSLIDQYQRTADTLLRLGRLQAAHHA